MTTDRRWWTRWLVAVATVLALLGVAGWWLHAYAVTRWPESVIRWSPSPDHVMRAALRDGPAEMPDDPADFAAATRRFTIAQLERGLGANARRDARTLLFIMARAGSEPAACAASRRLLAHPDPAIRIGVIRQMRRIPAALVPDMAGLLRDGDPAVVLSALYRLGERPRAAVAPPALIDALIARLAADPARPMLIPERNPGTNGVAEELSEPWPLRELAVDGPVAARTERPEERGWLAYWTRSQALSVLSAWDPGRAVAEVAARWPGWDAATRAELVFGSRFAELCGADCVGWVTAIARDPAAGRRPWGAETQACAALLTMACGIHGGWVTQATPANQAAWSAIVELVQQPRHDALDEALRGFTADPYAVFVAGLLATATPRQIGIIRSNLTSRALGDLVEEAVAAQAQVGAEH